jgi:hypothetical protein
VHRPFGHINTLDAEGLKDGLGYPSGRSETVILAKHAVMDRKDDFWFDGLGVFNGLFKFHPRAGNREGKDGNVLMGVVE